MALLDHFAGFILVCLALSILHQSGNFGDREKSFGLILIRVAVALIGFAVGVNFIFELVPVSHLVGLIWKSCVDLLLVGVVLLLKRRLNRI